MCLQHSHSCFWCTFPLIAKVPINVGCCVWCWVIFSDFPVPLSLLFENDTSSVIVFVSLPSHPHQRKIKREQLVANLRWRWPAPSAAGSCCFSEVAAL